MDQRLVYTIVAAVAGTLFAWAGRDLRAYYLLVAAPLTVALLAFQAFIVVHDHAIAVAFSSVEEQKEQLLADRNIGTSRAINLVVREARAAPLPSTLPWSACSFCLRTGVSNAIQAIESTKDQLVRSANGSPRRAFNLATRTAYETTFAASFSRSAAWALLLPALMILLIPLYAQHFGRRSTGANE